MENTCEIDRYYYYFDRSRQQRQGKLHSLAGFPYTHDKRLIADSLVLLKKGEESLVIAIEFYNDQNVNRMFKQLEKYLLALSIGYPSLQFDIERNTTVLLVFRYDSVAHVLKERIRKDTRFIPFKNYLLFTTLEKIRKGSFESTREDYEGNRMNLR